VRRVDEHADAHDYSEDAANNTSPRNDQPVIREVKFEPRAAAVRQAAQDVRRDVLFRCRELDGLILALFPTRLVSVGYRSSIQAPSGLFVCYSGCFIGRVAGKRGQEKEELEEDGERESELELAANRRAVVVVCVHGQQRDGRHGAESEHPHAEELIRAKMITGENGLYFWRLDGSQEGVRANGVKESKDDKQDINSHVLGLGQVHFCLWPKAFIEGDEGKAAKEK